jgi:hypothetical protein
MVTEPESRKGPGNRTPPTGRLTVDTPVTCGNAVSMTPLTDTTLTRQTRGTIGLLEGT